MTKDTKEEQLRQVQEEYPNPSVTNDVIKTEFEAYPGHLEQLNDDDDALKPVEESVVQNTTGGKTWNTIDEDLD